jgi:hypothetical protein
MLSAPPTPDEDLLVVVRSSAYNKFVDSGWWDDILRVKAKRL